jgi:hypothetical protein
MIKDMDVCLSGTNKYNDVRHEYETYVATRWWVRIGYCGEWFFVGAAPKASVSLRCTRAGLV